MAARQGVRHRLRQPGADLGNALGTTPGAQNRTPAALAAGDRFTLPVSPVSEPGSPALLLAGLDAVALAVRRCA